MERRSFSSPFALLGVVLLILAATVSGAAAASAEKPRQGGTATWLTSAEVPTLDPVSATAAASPSVLSVYDRLIYIDPTSGQVVPGLALSATASNNASVWTIKLRPNLKFTDGTALDAAAVKFNWDRIKNTPTALDRALVQGFTAYDAVDPTTVRVTLASANGALPVQLQRSLGSIASPAALTKFGTSYGTSPGTVVGAGPFKVSEWVRDDHMTLVRNDEYWAAPKPYLDSLVLKPVGDATQKANALIAGQADMAALPVISSADQLLQDARIKYVSVVQDGGFAILYNNAKAPLDDANVRKALTLATDPKDLNAKAASNLATMIDTWSPKGSPFYDSKVKQKTNNLAEAQKLIDSYVSAHGGTPITFSFLYSMSLKGWGDAQLQQWARLKNVNVVADLQPNSNAVSKGNSGNFDAYYASTGSGGRSAQFPQSMSELYQTGQSGNIQKFSSPALDKVFNDSRGAVTVAQRKEPLSQMSTILLDDAAFTMTFRLEQRNYYTAKMRGLKLVQPEFPGTADIWMSK